MCMTGLKEKKDKPFFFLIILINSKNVYFKKKEENNLQTCRSFHFVQNFIKITTLKFSSRIIPQYMAFRWNWGVWLSKIEIFWLIWKQKEKGRRVLEIFFEIMFFNLKKFKIEYENLEHTIMNFCFLAKTKINAMFFKTCSQQKSFEVFKFMNQKNHNLK